MSAAHIISRTDIHDTLTGETITTDECKDLPFDSFVWMEGNYACDCNRFLFFMRVKDPHLTDEDEDADDYPCDHGTPRFRVRLYDANDVLLYDDTQDFNAPFKVPE